MDLRGRGLRAPAVAIGDGALGFWSALRDVWPETTVQRDWCHKLANVLDKLPKRLRPRAKRALRDIMYAETKGDAERGLDAFVAEFEAKYPKAAACLAEDREALLAFFGFPAEHCPRRAGPQRHGSPRVVAASAAGARVTLTAVGEGAATVPAPWSATASTP